MATVKYNFKISLLNADDEVQKDGEKELILSDILSNVILTSSINENTMKYFDWALELKKTGSLTLDKTDKEMLSKYILSIPQLATLTKGRLNNVLLKEGK